MKNTLERIQKKKAEFDVFKPFPKTFMANMEEWYKIELTYTSNAIEGNTLTRQETALVVEKGITVEGKSIVEHLEAINHAKAYEYIQKLQFNNLKKINQSIILNIHSLILQNIDPQNAGRYRTTPVRIAGSTVVLPNPIKVPDLMKQFIVWLHNSKKTPAEIAVEAHFKLVSIHPFADGNGRTARLLMNLILLTNGYPPTVISNQNRKQYIESIEKGQLKDDLSDYDDFMFRAVEKSFDSFFETVNAEDKKRPVAKIFLKIGELAKKTKETVATIRFWTKERLLKVAKRSSGGYQLYSLHTIDRVKKIRKLQKERRLTLAELRRIV